ncbi:MAG: CoA-binding protein [Mycolicibacterium mageritense]|uniref:Trans-feruloyl-CoA synthase FCS1 n=1 Tax=Mycolicibacterium mageritense TaxID=53462 RepID=A0AAI8XPP9_MYCME|nr:MAG: CoA-binding protein [Mycolicibacterium mageritense]BDY32964.1 Trans-feruloyl-CoA synthase FCS1 [Mycolicibacterium mageritense]
MTGVDVSTDRNSEVTPTATRGATDLSVFSDPRSVAVVGASNDPAKWGYWLASGALVGSARRTVHFVNSRAGEVLGQPCVPSLLDLPEAPELVALCVPAAHVDTVVDQGLQRGVRGFLGITGGVTDDSALAARITAHGARLIGTNSLGIYDASSHLQLLWGRLTPGPLAIISQSGQLGSELADLGRRQGLGISRFVSIGNQSDVSAAELLADLAEHDATRVVALYLESFTDGETLFETIEQLRASGKPTVLLTVGSSSASTRMARSHTGSLTAPTDMVDAACRAAGVVRAGTPSEVVDIARTLLTAPPARGRRIAIVGDSGGQSAIAADVASGMRLAVVPFSEPVTADLADRLPAGAACANPIDLAGAGEQDMGNYAAIVERVVAAGEIDAVVMTGYFGCYGRDIPSSAAGEAAVAERLGAVVSASGVPVIVHTMGPETATAEALWRCGVPAFGTVEAAMRAVARTAALSPRAVVGRSTGVSDRPLGHGYWAARQLLEPLGIGFPTGAVIRTDADLAGVSGLRAPLVLKAGWLEHKSEVGGVRTGLVGPDELRDAFRDMQARLGDGDYVVEEQDTRPGAVEVLVGARRDPQLGAFVVVGAGGTETEMHQDVRIERAPVSHDIARQMLGELRMAPLLTGWRGRPAVDVDAVADLIVTVSELIADRRDIGEIELNPVRATPSGALAVDALVLGVAAHENCGQT